jgi:hypothetical protein
MSEPTTQVVITKYETISGAIGYKIAEMSDSRTVRNAYVTDQCPALINIVKAALGRLELSASYVPLANLHKDDHP